MTNSPAIPKFGPDILQIGIAHIIHRKDKKMVILLDTFPNIRIQPPSLFLVGFFSGFGLVDDAGTL